MKSKSPNIPLVLFISGIGIALLICLISLLAYGKIYFFEKYAVTIYGWFFSICAVVCSIIGFAIQHFLFRFKSWGTFLRTISAPFFISWLLIILLFDMEYHQQSYTILMSLLSIALGVLCIIVSFRVEDIINENEMSEVVSHMYAEFFNTTRIGSKDTSDLLDELWVSAKKIIQKNKDQFIKKNHIEVQEDTFSNLGLCGISKTHFYMHLDQITCHKLLDNNNLSFSWRRHNPYWIRCSLSEYIKLKNEGCQILHKQIALNSIHHFSIEGSIQQLANVRGGGVNLQGAVTGAIVGGSAAAIIGSQVGTDIKTDFVACDNRKITIFYKENGIMQVLEVKTTNADKTIKAFRKLMPNKEEFAVQIEAQNSANKSSAVSSAEEIMKYKKLLDQGIINQQEFDAKKKQLLGL